MLIYAELEYLLRIVLSALCAFFIGLERERRLKNAGIRTHIIVAISACLMMIISKYGFFDVLERGLSVDASRIAAGVVSAIGFLGAGVIYVRKETTVGLTTAAGLWATVGIGLALGSGMYVLGIATTICILLSQFLLHHMRFKTVGTTYAQVTVNMTHTGMSTTEIKDYFAKSEFILRGGSIKKGEEGELLFTCFLTFPRHLPAEAAIEIIEKIGTFKSIDINMVLF